MSTSAVAACMAPLLRRPLLAGECEIEIDFNVGGDGSAQLLQAAAAVNHAQAIVITLLEEYDKIFGVSCNDFFSVKTWDGATLESDAYIDDDLDNASSRSCSEFGGERERERGRRGRVMGGAFLALGMIIG
ncbi:hypothetical protein KPL71_003305 [Citrus sinensis]|uniref:Uncharacterized protein n=1 Tax=Citrus sinensis TaxID=2711 RepID=A0ACB8MWX8_CITSI|nr:hypothetical protein KPL71_003305 [Citrus sinensis]